MYNLRNKQMARMFDDFMLRSERKNCYNRVRELVREGLASAQEEVAERRVLLGKMLEEEAHQYEKEFTQQVKQRLKENLGIQSRPIMDKIRELEEEETRRMMKAKNLMRSLENCHEMREAMRQLEVRRTKESQLEQIIEKERAQRREKLLDAKWLELEKRQREKQIEEDRQVEELRKQIKQKNRCIKEQQLAESRARHEEERRLEIELRAATAKEAAEYAERERHERDIAERPKRLQYGIELRQAIAERAEAQRIKDEARLEQERLKLIELQMQEVDDTEEMKRRKAHNKKTSDEYLDYLRRTRNFEEQQERMRNERIADLAKVDICTKNNLAATFKKRKEAELQYRRELDEQRCKERERRFLQDMKRRECAMYENRFVKSERTREQVRKMQWQQREDLEKQMAELAMLRAKERQIECEFQKQKELESDICIRMTEDFLKEGYSFEDLHPNWSILYSGKTMNDSCKKHEFTDKMAGVGLPEASKKDAVAANKPAALLPTGGCWKKEEPKPEVTFDWFCTTGAAPGIYCPQQEVVHSTKCNSSCDQIEELKKMQISCKGNFEFGRYVTH